MENPNTWNKTTVEINRLYLQWIKMTNDGTIGLSLGAYLSKKLNELGYLTNQALEPNESQEKCSECGGNINKPLWIKTGQSGCGDVFGYSCNSRFHTQNKTKTNEELEVTYTGAW